MPPTLPFELASSQHSKVSPACTGSSACGICHQCTFYRNGIYQGASPHERSNTRYKHRRKHANTTSCAQSLPRTCLPSLWCFGHRFTALSALGGFRGLIGILTLFMRAFFAEDMTPQLAQDPRPAAESRVQRDTKVRDPLLLPSDRYVLSP